LTGSTAGSQLLLKAVPVGVRCRFEANRLVVSRIYLAFNQRAEELREGFLETVLHDAIYGTPAQQDSRHYVSRGEESQRVLPLEKKAK
jgi:hypothetical protein